MSFNIVDLVKDQVKGQLIGHMGNLLGDEGGKATGAVDSMIPALLNGITGTAGSEDGANSLFGAIQDQDDSTLDNLGSLLTDGQASKVIDTGNSVLSSLFGSGGLSKLASALSAFSGVSKGGTSSLMGMLAPIVLGVIKRKVMGDGLNASSLASMLSSQSTNVSAALPQGLTDQLNTSGFLSSIGGLTGAGAGIAAGAAGAVTAGAANLTSGARDAASSAVSGVTDAAGALGDGVADVAGNARDSVANAAGALGDGVAGVAGNARDGVANAASAVGDGVADVAGNARDGVANAAGAVGDTAKKGGSMFRWLLPLIVLAGLAWAAFTYLLPGAKDAAGDAAGKLSEGAAAVTETATNAATSATDAVKDTAAAAVDATKDAASTAVDATKDAAASAVDATKDAAASATDAATSSIAIPANPAEVGDKLSGLFSGASETLGGITDLDSAKAALPALGELGDNVESVSGLLDSVPSAARGPLSKIAAEGFGMLKPIVDKVMAIPGVGSVVGPVLEPIVERLQEFGG